MLDTEVSLSIVGGAGDIRLARNLDALSRAELAQLQAHNLRAMVAAAQGVPAVAAAHPGLARVREPADIAELPLLSPAAFAESCPPSSAAHRLDDDDAGMVLRSSGTAGRSKTVYHSWEFTRQVELLGARGVTAVLPQPPRRIANCMVPAELNGSMLFVHGLGRLLPALVFPLGSSTRVDETIELIAEHRIDTLVAGPIYGADLLSAAPPERIPALRNFLYLGEAMGPVRSRIVAEANPGVRVRSVAYSTSETGPIGYQCTQRDGLAHHVHEDAVLVEIVDEQTGRPVPDGTEGEVVVTPLSDTGMALFRYRIGDRGYLEPDACPCGSPARVLMLLGRTAQSLNVQGWTISSAQLMACLGPLGVTDPADCQFQVLWDIPTFRVRLLLSTRTPEGIDAEQVTAIFRSAFQLDRIVNSPRCTGFSVERREWHDFAVNDRGKVPVLYQHM